MVGDDKEIVILGTARQLHIESHSSWDTYAKTMQVLGRPILSIERGVGHTI